MGGTALRAGILAQWFERYATMVVNGMQFTKK